MTYEPRSDFLHALKTRGFIQDCTDMQGLDEAMLKGVVPGYIGFDCTADSLHVGSLVQIMMLRALQKAGHKPIVLMGGGTTKVGDPSGKDAARPLLSEHDIEQNKNGIFSVFKKYLTFGDGPTDAVMVDNASWLDDLAYIRFLRDYGPHFSVNRMLGMDSVKLRLEREHEMHTRAVLDLGERDREPEQVRRVRLAWPRVALGTAVPERHRTHDTRAPAETLQQPRDRA